MTYSVINKDSQENTNIAVNWTSWLEGDTIAVSDWVVPAGLTVSLEQNTTTTTNVWIDGGTLGDHYYISNTITTTAGRTTKRTFVVRITDK